jgi:hypothetical protein
VPVERAVRLVDSTDIALTSLTKRRRRTQDGRCGASDEQPRPCATSGHAASPLSTLARGRFAQPMAEASGPHLPAALDMNIA